MISLKAKDLLSQMLSLPDDWNYTLSGLSHIHRESKDAIRTAIIDLCEATSCPPPLVCEAADQPP